MSRQALVCRRHTIKLSESELVFFQEAKQRAKCRKKICIVAKIKQTSKNMLHKNLFNRQYLASRAFNLCGAIVLGAQVCQADLAFTVSDNGNDTTDWTISGSGTAQSTLSSETFSTLFFTTIGGGNFSTGGAWTLGGNSTTFAFAGDGGLANDYIRFQFTSDVTVGTDISGITGTVTFPTAFADLTLPLSLSGDAVWGDVTVAAVPEPSTIAYGAGTLILAISAVRSKRRRNLRP